MKRINIIKTILILFMAIIFLPASNAQAGGENGIHVSGGSSSGTKISSNIGNSTIATGYNSFASGYASEASGHTSTALGREAKALGAYSGAFGNFVKAVANNSFVLGTGFSSTLPLTNSAAGIMMGVNSQQPTLTITAAANATRTGKIAIGNVASPSAKLHIAGDGVENADILLASTGSNKSIIQFRNSSNNITVGSDNVMKFNAPNMQFYPTGQVAVNGAFKATGKVTLSGLAGSSSKVLTVGANGQLSSVEYSTFYDDLGNHTAEQNINLNGKKIVNGTSGLGGIFVSTDGKVGINTENITTAYALAVDGGLITTKVHIQDVNDWQDRVFDADYPLMTLDDVEEYVAEHRHLPGIPSEAEVKAAGFDLAVMTSALLGKVEELTLYAIRQQREIDSLRDLVTVRFGYDACGNRTRRTLEFSMVEEERGTSPGGTPHDAGAQWQASLSDSFAGVEATLFPNPTEGGFFVLLGGELPGDATATLCAIDGTVLEKRVVSSVTEEFDLSRRPAGIYLLRLSAGHETRVWKVIKRN